MPTEEAQKVAHALAAAAVISAPGLRVRRTIPGGVGTITEGVIAKRNADAKHRADNLKVKITDMQIEIDTFKNKRDQIIKVLRGEKDQLDGELAELLNDMKILEKQQEDLEEEIKKSQLRVTALQAQVLDTQTYVVNMKDALKIYQEKTATNAHHISWAATQDQPKIDQLTVKRDKLITRLYHLHNLHPALSSAEKESKENV
ncbi:hypothetical protein LCGC14_0375100 [marine sediment metagenome]|uniref:Uncharacterized protein n=1 Tax=marine sediment metagenome TaxID=412755 RepID=A0A0F9WCN0_9ZZZZ